MAPLLCFAGRCHVGLRRRVSVLGGELREGDGRKTGDLSLYAMHAVYLASYPALAECIG